MKTRGPGAGAEGDAETAGAEVRLMPVETPAASLLDPLGLTLPDLDSGPPPVNPNADETLETDDFDDALALEADDCPSSDDGFSDFLAELAHSPEVSLASVPAPVPTPEVGEVVGEQFEIVRRLGEGGMGVVFLARDLMLGRQVAVKVLKFDGRSAREREALLRSFERDGTATARLKHPNVITIYHLGQVHGAPYLVLEFLRGRELSTWMREQPLTPTEALDVAIQIARALVHAHAHGVIHRDLKPQNVFVQDDGVVKVLDFGLAALERVVLGPDEGADGDPDRDGPPLHAGTPAYMAPEQWRGEAQDARCDVWALGVMLFEMLTGKLPFARSREVAYGEGEAPRVSVVAPAIGDAFDAVLAGALARALEDRSPTAEGLLERLERVRAELVSPQLSSLPYRYLESFTEADEGWFFGRERESGRLMTALRTRPFLAVVGPSGAGKSSLVNAGLIPRLRRSPEGCEVLRSRPGHDPVGQLFRGLCALDETATLALIDDAEALAAAPGRAGQVLRRVAAARGRRVVVFIDQLEELYTRTESAEARVRFVQALLSAGDDAASPVRVVVTLREDFLSRLAEHEALRDAVVANVAPLGAPSSEAMLSALMEPARRLGFRFEGELAHRMVAELRGEAAPLPLLQFAVSQLWERRNREQRLLEEYVLQALGGVAGILVAHADVVLGGLSEAKDLEVARRALCRLVTPEGTRRSVEQGALVALFGSGEAQRVERVLGHLIAGRLLTSSRAGAASSLVELAHDSLIDRWDTLRGWLFDNLEERQFRAQLEGAVAHWVGAGRPEALLWRDEILDAAVLLEQRQGLELQRVEAEFLGESQRRQSRGKRLRQAALVTLLLIAMGVAGASYAAMLQFDAQRIQAEQGWARAQQERQKAESARTQAEQLAEGMLFDIREQIEPLGRLDLLEQIAKSVDVYLDETAEGTGELAQDRVLRQRGVVMRILGDLERARGDLGQAERHFVLSREALEQLNARDPGSAVWRRELSITYRRIGSVFGERGDVATALAYFNKSLELIVPVATAYNATPRSKEELGQVHYALGNAHLDLERAQASASHYADGQSVYEGLRAAEPDKTRWRRGVAIGYEKLGDVAMLEHRVELASGYYTQALEHAEALAASDPRNIRWQRDVAVLYERMGDTRMDSDAFDEAAGWHARSLLVVERIADLDPKNVSWKRDIAISHEKIGEAHAARDDYHQALKDYERSLKVTLPLARADANNATWQRDLAVTYERMAVFHSRLSNAPEAERHFGASYEIRKALVTANPEHLPWRFEMTLLLREYGRALLVHGEPAAALERFDEAMTSFEALLGPTSSLDWVLAAARTAFYRAQAYVTQGNDVEAREDYARAREYLARIALAEALHPDDARWDAELEADLASSAPLPRREVLALEIDVGPPQATPAPEEVGSRKKKAAPLLIPE